MSTTDIISNAASQDGDRIVQGHEPRTVTAKINYAGLAPDGSARYIKTYEIDPATGQSARNWKEETYEVLVEDLRGKENSVSLDVNGFQYGSHMTKVQKTFYDEEEIKEVYYSESIELIKSLTGANRVVVFDHTIRRHIIGENGQDAKKRQPVQNAHVDQTPAAAESRVYRYLPAEEAAELIKKRYQVINLWRPISHPAWDTPLALCDYTSLEPSKDLSSTSLLFKDRKGESFGVLFNPNHHWKYVSGLRPDEYVIFKCSETKEGVAQLAPHTAFVNPAAPAGAPLRESIELRTLVFYN